jgi:hypothetical protein
MQQGIGPALVVDEDYRPQASGPTLAPVIRKAGRWLSPGALVLAALCFALPFASVSCTTPGGYAGAAPGGTTTYSGVALVVGGAPEVTEEHQRPVPPGEDDRLPPQPALAGALFAVLAATVLAVAVGHARSRRAAVAIVAAVGCFALVVGQAIVVGELTTRVADHLVRVAQTQPAEPPGPAEEYVQTGPGFGLCLVLLALVAVANGVGWRRLRPRPALVAHDSS